MNTTAQDRASVAGKALTVAEKTSLLVIGAGPAGLAAAIEAARRGIAVTLVDENPVPFETMGEEIPLHFGQRMGGIVRNRTAMTEAVLEQAPDIAVAFEAGVDVVPGHRGMGTLRAAADRRMDARTGLRSGRP